MCGFEKYDLKSESVFFVLNIYVKGFSKIFVAVFRPPKIPPEFDKNIDPKTV